MTGLTDHLAEHLDVILAGRARRLETPAGPIDPRDTLAAVDALADEGIVPWPAALAHGRCAGRPDCPNPIPASLAYCRPCVGIDPR